MLPKEFKERMTNLLGDESEAFFAELESGEPVRAFRVNNIKLSGEAFEAAKPEILRKKAKFPEEAYYTTEAFPGSLPCHHAGMIYMQDPSAMATVHAIKIPKGAKVLDSCSAPGGKTTQLSAFVGESGVVVANEYEAKRCRVLLSNVERMGCKNTVVVNLDTSVLAETYPEKFDVVLCDAPCSGEGMFRKNELAVGEWSLENVVMCAERQREILANVAKCVSSGGRLIYSTCTFSLEENEINVAWFLDNFKDFSLVDTATELQAVTADGILLENCPYDMKKTRRFYPHVSKGEGQFIAVFEKNTQSQATEKDDFVKGKKKKNNTERPAKDEAELIFEAEKFLKENLCRDFARGVKYTMAAINGRAYLKPDVDLPKYGIFAAGVCVGEMVGKRFAPHHQLFSAFGNEFLRRVELTHGEKATSDYLKGMEISISENLKYESKPDGYAAVIVDGCAVGGGKVSGGVCKNHYPKGLRNQQ